MTDHAPIITAIAPDPDDPNLRAVIVDERVVLSLPAAAVDTLALDVGQAWTAATEASARLEAAASEIRDEALKLLGRRDHSRAELAGRLEQRGHDRAAVERAVAQLEADRWLDDEAFAKAVVRRMLAKRPAGPALLVGRLVERRVDAELAQRVVAAAVRGQDQVAAAVEVARRRLGDDHEPASVRRAVAALHRRGFDGDTIEAALDRLGLANGIE